MLQINIEVKNYLLVSSNPPDRLDDSIVIIIVVEKIKIKVEVKNMKSYSRDRRAYEFLQTDA